MVTGASTAQAAIIRIDASRVIDGGLLPQTKRHSTLARLLGLRHIVVAVNKMDLVDWRQDTFERIRQAYGELAAKLGIERSEEHTSELQSLMRISYAVFCLKKKKITPISTKLNATQTRIPHTRHT